MRRVNCNSNTFGIEGLAQVVFFICWAESFTFCCCCCCCSFVLDYLGTRCVIEFIYIFKPIWSYWIAVKRYGIFYVIVLIQFGMLLLLPSTQPRFTSLTRLAVQHTMRTRWYFYYMMLRMRTHIHAYVSEALLIFLYFFLFSTIQINRMHLYFCLSSLYLAVYLCVCAYISFGFCSPVYYYVYINVYIYILVGYINLLARSHSYIHALPYVFILNETETTWVDDQKVRVTLVTT